MSELAKDLLTFYQRELTSGESLDAQQACEKLGVTDARVFERYGVGYCSGAAIETMGEKQQRQGIYQLLGSVVDHFEEDISPSAMRLLQKLNDEGTKFVTRQQVMDLMGGWSYSRAYRVLRELNGLDLLIADNQTNGVLRTYEVAASQIGAESKVSQLAPPEVVFNEEAVEV